MTKKIRLSEGMDKIYKQLMTTLDGIGVKPIESSWSRNLTRISTMQ